MSEQRTEKSASSQPHVPPADPSFFRIVESIAVPALIWTGHLRNPLDEKAEPDLELAKYQIGLLEVLEKKTKGNLEKDEEDFLGNMLHSVRLAYVRATEAEAAQPPATESSDAGEKSESEKSEGEKNDQQ
jgi:hypothetical protein